MDDETLVTKLYCNHVFHVASMLGENQRLNRRIHARCAGVVVDDIHVRE